MSSERHLLGIPISQLRRRAIYIAAGIYAVATLVALPISTAAASGTEAGAANVQEFDWSIVQRSDDAIHWKIIRIIAPKDDQELGVIVFGEGQSLLSPSSMRGPR